MVTEFYSWVKNIAFYLILVAMLIHILPNSNYKKYVKFFTGLLLVIIVISPVIKLLRAEDTLDQSYLIENIKEEYSSIKNSDEDVGYVQQEAILRAYQREVESQIGEIVRSQGLYPTKVSVTLGINSEYGVESVEQVSIAASLEEVQDSGIYIEDVQIGQDESDTLQEINIKNELEEVYNISASNINISIQR